MAAAAGESCGVVRWPGRPAPAGSGSDAAVPAVAASAEPVSDCRGSAVPVVVDSRAWQADAGDDVVPRGSGAAVPPRDLRVPGSSGSCV